MPNLEVLHVNSLSASETFSLSRIATELGSARQGGSSCITGKNVLKELIVDGYTREYCESMESYCNLPVTFPELEMLKVNVDARSLKRIKFQAKFDRLKCLDVDIKFGNMTARSSEYDNYVTHFMTQLKDCCLNLEVLCVWITSNRYDYLPLIHFDSMLKNLKGCV